MATTSPFDLVSPLAEALGIDDVIATRYGERDGAYDGSIADETTFVVMGGMTEPVSASLKESFAVGWSLGEALRGAVAALGAVGENAPRTLTAAQLEVAVLDRRRSGRTFRRIVGAELDVLLGPGQRDAPAATPESAETTAPADTGELSVPPVQAIDEPELAAPPPADPAEGSDQP